MAETSLSEIFKLFCREPSSLDSLRPLASIMVIILLGSLQNSIMKIQKYSMIIIIHQSRKPETQVTINGSFGNLLHLFLLQHLSSYIILSNSFLLLFPLSLSSFSFLFLFPLSLSVSFHNIYQCIVGGLL